MPVSEEESLTDRRESSAVLALPRREELIIRGAYVLTMDDHLGDIPGADIHVRDGEIISVAKHVDAPSATVIDAGGLVAMPGFIDTHTHVWTGLMRSLIRDGPPGDYNTLKAQLGPLFRPPDTYWATLCGAAEALTAGITSLHNWAHNIRQPDDADASMRAHTDLGLRGRFSYGSATDTGPASLMDLNDLPRIRNAWIANRGDSLVDLGMALRGPYLTPERVYRAEWEAARDLRLPVTIHYASYRAEVARIKVLQVLDRDGLLDVDLQLIHGLYATNDDRALMRSAGASLSCAPLAVLRNGLGLPSIREMLDDHIQVSLSLDTASLAGSLDMFAAMRTLLMVEHGKHENTELQAREVLRLATLEGARDLDILDKVGSITPGKRADLLLLDFRSLNTEPALTEDGLADIATLIVYSCAPQNVDTVMIDGRLLKRNGRLTSVDIDATIEGGRRTLSSILARRT